MLTSSRTVQTLVAVLIALVLIVPGQLARPAAAQVSGNSWISPNFDFSISWDDTWFVVDETSTSDYDRVVLTNGLTYCTLVGGPDSSTTAEAGLARSR